MYLYEGSHVQKVCGTFSSCSHCSYKNAPGIENMIYLEDYKHLKEIKILLQNAIISLFDIIVQPS